MSKSHRYSRIEIAKYLLEVCPFQGRVQDMSYAEELYDGKCDYCIHEIEATRLTEDLGLDSIDVNTMVYDAMVRFGISDADTCLEDGSSFQTLGDLITVLDKAQESADA